MTTARRHPLASLAVLSLVTPLVHGYHPFAEDGGIYVSGVKWALRPSLFPHDAAFVTARRSYSLFDPILCALVRCTHLSLETVLFASQILCIFLTLLGVFRLAAICFRQPLAPLYAAACAAAACTLPVAGTSLFFMEPYVTARSLTTPLSLLSISFLLDRRNMKRRRINMTVALALLVGASAFHVAMAAYTAALLALLCVRGIRDARTRMFVMVALITVSVCGCILLQLHSPGESTLALEAARTRTYWFLSQWQWYEWLGLVCPLAVFALALRFSFKNLTTDGRLLFSTCILAGAVAVAFSICFARTGMSALPIARLQPLRMFHNLYGTLLVLLGAWLGAWHSRLQRGRRWLAVLPLVAVAAVMFAVQRTSFPASGHVEWPGPFPANPYSRAFFWARRNTPQDALFALDADYITREREDAQNFRAIAERSMLSDYSKDGGVAAIRPSLAAAWRSGSDASAGLSLMSASDRAARLQPLGITWLVLRSSASTANPCPYDNGTVKVCPLE